MLGSPAFQFYAADYLADERVQLLTLEEEGAYIRLLAYCWREGSIPSDIKSLAMLAKGASEQVLNVCSKMFEPMRRNPSRLIHKRLDWERQKQEQNREQKRLSGLASGVSRRNKALDDEQMLNKCSTEGPPSVRTKSNSSSSSSSSSSVEEKKETSSLKKSRVKKSPQTADEVISEIQAEPAFVGLDVRAKYNECVAYCHARNYGAPNKQRLTNWCLEALRRAPLFINGIGSSTPILQDKPYLEKFDTRSKPDGP